MVGLKNKNNNNNIGGGGEERKTGDEQEQDVLQPSQSLLSRGFTIEEDEVDYLRKLLNEERKRIRQLEILLSEKGINSSRKVSKDVRTISKDNNNIPFSSSQRQVSSSSTGQGQRPLLFRHESSTFRQVKEEREIDDILSFKDISDVQHGLRNGVDKYFEKVKPILQGIIGVDVRFNNLNVTVDGEDDGDISYDTVGSKLSDMVLGVPKKIVKNRRKSQTETTTTTSNNNTSTGEKINILNQASGILKQGTFTLLLGPPSSGKSTLLKALAGRLKNEKGFEGRITYNGCNYDSGDFNLRSVSTLVDQNDRHAPVLTVGETIQFAYDCMSAGTHANPDLVNPDYDSLIYEFDRANTRVNLILNILGLKHVENTIVGNQQIRGVSGGERKRVTTGEMALSHCSVYLLDAISVGLDSAATFDICFALQRACKILNKTVIVSLQQPSPETFGLFDDVMLMDEGSIVYHGPCEKVEKYFYDIGFECPEAKDVADFLVEVTTEEGRSLYARNQDDVINLIPKTINDFVNAYKSSSYWTEREQDLIFCDKSQYPKWPMVMQRKYQNSWIRSTQLCIQRLSKLTLRDRSFMLSRFGQCAIMGAIGGTMYYQLPETKYANIFGSLFFSSMFLALGAMNTMPALMEKRNVFYKQCDAGFFPASSYVIASVIVGLPVQMVESILFSTIFYNLVGLSGSGHFFTFLATIFSLAVNMSQLFFLAVASMPTMTSCQPVSGVLIMLFILFSGFIVTAQNIPIGWKWIYYYNPIAWTVRALAINEFTDDRYSTLVPSGTGDGLVPLGHAVLDNFGLPYSRSWIVTSLAIVWIEWIILLVLSVYAMTNIRHSTSGKATIKKGTIETTKERKTHGSHGEDGALVIDMQEPLLSETEGTTNQESDFPEFPQATLAFENLIYSVDVPGGERIQLLKGITGYCKPGTMTALMGSSGAGKTTLLDVLAGRKTGGYIDGNVTINGYPKKQETFTRISGYVEQIDVHSPHSTIREALMFSAKLRLSGVKDDKTRSAFVEHVLQLLELQDKADKLIGDADTGLAIDERKRLTIGVELVANPSILFLDEPTSGLDAHGADVVMNVIRKIAQTGRSVICTIHQPSVSLFGVFDMLLLLKRGGKTVYFGPLGDKSVKLIDYLESIEGTKPFAVGQNPATWMLEVIGAGTGSNNLNAIDYAQMYEMSGLCTLNYEDILVFGNPEGQMELKFDSPYVASTYLQFAACIEKAVINYWRTPSYNLVRLILAFMLSLIVGSIFCGGGVPQTESAVISRVGGIYISNIFMGVIALTTVMPVMAVERGSFYREQSSKMYTPSAYTFSWGIAEIPYVLGSSLIFVSIFYNIIGLQHSWGPFLYFYTYFTLYMFANVFMGQFFLCLAPTTQTAQVIAGALNSIFNLFSGYLCNADDIPQFWKFIYYIAPSHYAFEGLIMTQFHDDDNTIPIVTPAGVVSVTTENYINTRYAGFSYDHRFINMYVLLGYIMFFRIATAIVLKYVNHQKR